MPGFPWVARGLCRHTLSWVVRDWITDYKSVWTPLSLVLELSLRSFAPGFRGGTAQGLLDVGVSLGGAGP